MMNRTNRGASRPLGKMKFRGIGRAKSPDSPPARIKSHEVYPVRVKSHDGYVECNSSILADLNDLVLGEQSPPLRLKFEIAGNWFGRDLALKYGYASSRGAEVNGVLVGKQGASRVLILAFRQMDAGLACDASSLSEEWQSAFADLMARIRWDPKLSGLQGCAPEVPPTESVALTVTLNDPAVCGVPLMSPLEELIVKLAGRPLAVHVRPPVPP